MELINLERELIIDKFDVELIKWNRPHAWRETYINPFRITNEAVFFCI